MFTAISSDSERDLLYEISVRQTGWLTCKTERRNFRSGIRKLGKTGRWGVLTIQNYAPAPRTAGVSLGWIDSADWVISCFQVPVMPVTQPHRSKETLSISSFAGLAWTVFRSGKVLKTMSFQGNTPASHDRHCSHTAEQPMRHPFPSKLCTLNARGTSRFESCRYMES